MVTSRAAILFNGLAVSLSDVPLLDSYEFRHELGSRLHQDGRLSALFSMPQGTEHTRLFAVIGDPRLGQLAVCSTMVGDRYESLATTIPQAHYFEREIAEQRGITPEGHPELQPVRFHAHDRVGLQTPQHSVRTTLRPGMPQDRLDTTAPVGSTVTIGPLLAGITESAQFRLQCQDESIGDVEIQLGYQHRGIERAIRVGQSKRVQHLIELLDGETTIGQVTAYSQALEALSATTIPMRVQIIRGVALELERLAQHTGVLAAIAQDVGFLPTAGRCGGLRHEFQELMALICGSRLGRSLIRPGGTGFDLDAIRIDQIQHRLVTAIQEVGAAVELLWKSPTVQSRFENCGVLTPETCVELGLVGPIARACGRETDVRHDFPAGIYRYHQVAVSTVRTGDVSARAFVRWLEIQRSAEFIQQQLDFLNKLKPGPVLVPLGQLRADALTVSLVEGWRGEICHVGITDSIGKLAHYKICDAAFHNWPALAVAVRDQSLSDFSLIAQSLSLSASGHDL